MKTRQASTITTVFVLCLLTGVSGAWAYYRYCTVRGRMMASELGRTFYHQTRSAHPDVMFLDWEGPLAIEKLDRHVERLYQIEIEELMRESRDDVATHEQLLRYNKRPDDYETIYLTESRKSAENSKKLAAVLREFEGTSRVYGYFSMRHTGTNFVGIVWSRLPGRIEHVDARVSGQYVTYFRR